MLRGALAALAVLAGSLALELGYGVSLGAGLLYLAYEAGFVVLPGWLAYLALSHRPGGALRQLALGWALGYVLEILAFMLTAATGTRGLFLAYPFVVALVAVAIIRRRKATVPGVSGPEMPARLVLPIAAVCLVAVAYIGFSYFPTTPLPGTESVAYFPDYPRWIAIAADAKHHWPITDPSVAGEPLPYHYFVNVHLAAASEVTGLDLPLVFFRLFVFPLVVLSVLLMVVAGSSLTRSASVGLIGACLAFFVGELRLDASNSFLAHTPFLGLFFTFLYRSPSFLLGLVFLVALIVLIGERLASRQATVRPGDWLLVAIFAVGASDAKIAILPLVLAALLLYAGWIWLAERRVRSAVWIAGGIVAAVLGAVYALQYRGHSSGLGVDPFYAFDQMPAVHLIKADLLEHLASFPGKEALLSGGAVLLGSIGLLAATLIGISWLLRSRGPHLGAARIWLFCVLGAGLVLSFALSEPATVSGWYFVSYGLVAGCLLSADGLRIAWQRRPSLSGKWNRMAVLGLVFLLVLVALIGAPAWLDPFSGPRAEASTYMLRYGGLALALVVLYVAARAWIGPTRWAAAALVSAALLVVGALATPFDTLAPAARHPDAGGFGVFKEMSPDLYAALTWVRDHTPTDSLIAVNNQWVDTANTSPLEFNYSAFAERRVYLEGWAYSQRARDLGYAAVGGGANPFADRLALNRAAFEGGDPGALRRQGVDYLIVDEANGYPADTRRLAQFSRLVYRAPGVLVLDLGPA
jgi:hypothetical protein